MSTITLKESLDNLGEKVNKEALRKSLEEKKRILEGDKTVQK